MMKNILILTAVLWAAFFIPAYAQDKKISALTGCSSLAGTETLVAVQSAANCSMTANQIVNLVPSSSIYDGADGSIIISPASSSVANSNNSVVIGDGLSAGTLIGDEIMIVGYSDGSTTNGRSHTVDGTGSVAVGRFIHSYGTNIVSVGESLVYSTTGTTASPADGKGFNLGHDNYIYESNYAFMIGSNLRSGTYSAPGSDSNAYSGCDYCGSWGHDIQNNQDGSFAIGGEAATTMTVATTDTLWTDKYIRMIQETTGNLATCDSDREGQLAYDTSDNDVVFCNASDWASLTTSPLTIDDKSSTTYTLTLDDIGDYIRLSNASAITLTVPPNSTAAFATGTQIPIIQVGAGQVTVAQGSGVTINTSETLKLRGQWSAATLIKVATNTWDLVGDLEEAP